MKTVLSTKRRCRDASGVVSRIGIDGSLRRLFISSERTPQEGRLSSLDLPKICVEYGRIERQLDLQQHEHHGERGYQDYLSVAEPHLRRGHVNGHRQAHG